MSNNARFDSKMISIACSTVAAAVLVTGCWSLFAPVAAANDSKDNRLFEMRTYTTADGKLDALHARFRDHTNRLFEKHGMTLIGYWTPVEGEAAGKTLVYVLAYPDGEAREASWKGFLADSDWKKAYKESIADGRLVTKIANQFLSPTDYSPIK